jgi:hypothetical protein
VTFVAISDLSREALAAARRVRIKAKTPSDSPLCIFDLIEENYRDEADLWFKAAPSLEGLYVKGDPMVVQPAVVVVSSLRPSGRQRVTAAHELGHHLFGHGSSVDQVRESGESGAFEPEEFLATQFASCLLMPKLGILKAFAVRGIGIREATPKQILAVASQFGVGYSTLINHLYYMLKELPEARATALAKVTPNKLREEILGHRAEGELLLVDDHWVGRAIDLAVGDHAVVPAGTAVEGATVKFIGTGAHGDVYQARAPGRGRLENKSNGLTSYVRVCRSGYQGRSMFRHLEDEDE